MENVKEIIAKNLAELRKSNKLTQSALAEKLGYSDKAISRWERGETLPDIETLCRVCDIYGVKFEYLLQAEQPEASKNPYIKREDKLRQIIICLIAMCTVWLASTVLFTLIKSRWDAYVWQLFIWAIPVTGFVAGFCNMRWWHSRIVSIIVLSFNTWTLILAIYIQMLEANLWMLFIVGVPIQAIIILSKAFGKKG